MPTLRVEQTVAQFASNFEAQLDFRDEATNLDAFRHNFSSSFWQSLVTFPRPIAGLVAQHVLVETFEPGESVASFLDAKGELREGEWVLVNGRWEMVGADDREGADDRRLRGSIALTGIQALLKMIVWDNMIHADLHPGNVLIRMAELGPFARLQRWLVMGDASERVPHIVLLDAGLAASFDASLYSHVKAFFEAVADDAADKYGDAILNLSRTQPYLPSRELFKREVREKCERQKEQFNAGGGRAGQNIREYLTSVREHNVVIDPTVMVSVMSVMVLEGWQTRLDPSVCIFDQLQVARGSGAFGMAQRAHELFMSVFGAAQT